MGDLWERGRKVYRIVVNYEAAFRNATKAMIIGVNFPAELSRGRVVEEWGLLEDGVVVMWKRKIGGCFGNGLGMVWDGCGVRNWRIARGAWGSGAISRGGLKRDGDFGGGRLRMEIGSEWVIGCICSWRGV
jgi:hypothetical protein